jgi:hypothetical protein
MIRRDPICYLKLRQPFLRFLLGKSDKNVYTGYSSTITYWNLRRKVYKNNPRSIEALQNEITRVIGSIAVDELQRVSRIYLFMRCEACLQAEGGHFQHLI